MLTDFELAYLYYLARERYTGSGQIVDLGPYCGVGTLALASGLRANPRGAHKKIFSYDLYLAEGYDWFFDQGQAPPTRSVFPIYLDILRDHLDQIAPVPGDLLKMKWTGEPIEILFVDIAKNWALNNWVLKETFPCLIPGKSIVIQQDYIHFNEWWLQVVMEHYADRFELLEVIFGASAIFRTMAPISLQEAQQDLSTLTLDQKLCLLEQAQRRVPLSAAEVLKCARAKCCIDHGAHDEAEKILATVSRERLIDDPVLDFSGIARDNVYKVEALLKQHRETHQRT